MFRLREQVVTACRRLYERNLVGGYQFTRLPISATPGDPLRANGDPNDDVLGFTMDSGPSPNGADGKLCPKDVGRGLATCASAVGEENDWHLHAIGLTAAENQGYDPPARGGIAAPDGGKAHKGLRSMHMGRHTDPSTTLGDALRFRQVSAFVLDSQGTALPGIALGPATTGEFWHIVSTPDSENAGNGYISDGYTFGGSQVQISLLGSNGKFEKWQIVTPSANGYDSIIQGTITICEFDPGDDQLPPGDNTMCHNNSMWADLGDVIGTDDTCLTDTDGNDAAHKDCGRTTTKTADFIDASAVGSGVWAKSVFGLSAFAGRVARLRWIGMEGGGWSFGISRSFLEPQPGGTIYQYYDGDDGWWIDDIRLSDIRTSASTIGPDNLTGLYRCGGAGAGVCSGPTVTVAGSTPYGQTWDPTGVWTSYLPSDAAGVGVRLDARRSGGACPNGVFLCQWSRVDPTIDPNAAGHVIEVIQPYSPDCQLDVAPMQRTTYQLDMYCSSDPNCKSYREVVVDPYRGDPGTSTDMVARLDPSLLLAIDPNTAGLYYLKGGGNWNVYKARRSSVTTPLVIATGGIGWPNNPGGDQFIGEKVGFPSTTDVPPLGKCLVQLDIGGGGWRLIANSVIAIPPLPGEVWYYNVGKVTALAGPNACNNVLGWSRPNVDPSGIGVPWDDNGDGSNVVENTTWSIGLRPPRASRNRWSGGGSTGAACAVDCTW
jgi:hypothetical protein